MLFTDFCLSVMYFLVAFNNKGGRSLGMLFSTIVYSLHLNFPNESYNFGSLCNPISSKDYWNLTAINHSQIRQKSNWLRKLSLVLTILHFSMCPVENSLVENFESNLIFLVSSMFARIQIKSSLGLVSWFQLIIPVFKSAPHSKVLKIFRAADMSFGNKLVSREKSLHCYFLLLTECWLGIPKWRVHY